MHFPGLFLSSNSPAIAASHAGCDQPVLATQGGAIVSARSENDAQVPMKLNVGHHQQEVLTGELRLMAAVLEDAIQSYLRNFDARNALNRFEFVEVQRWFNARNQQGLFAFESVCCLLGVDSGLLRRSVRMLAVDRRSGRPSAPQISTHDSSPQSSSRRGGKRPSGSLPAGCRARFSARQVAQNKTS
jgi:hypothetical protein